VRVTVVVGRVTVVDARVTVVVAVVLLYTVLPWRGTNAEAAAIGTTSKVVEAGDGYPDATEA
jgi:hypothetical protein